MTARYEMDMTSGPLFGKIVRFAVPLALAHLLQLAFDAADMVVIGNFSSHESLAAIGATNSITTLLMTLAIGIGGGVNVVAAQLYGARDRRGVGRTVHTSAALALFMGAVMMLIGLVAARPLLLLIRTPAEIFDRARLYLQLRFLGIPFLLFYNFGSALLRAVGDTKRPLYYLTAAGVVNVALNLFFVVVCKMDVAGVAFATAVSKALSAYLVIRALMDSRDAVRLVPGKIKLYSAELGRILWIGIPSGLQSSCFALSNVIIAAAINSFGALTVAGNTAAYTLEMLLHVATVAMYQTVLSFVGQNYGAGNYERMLRCIRVCAICAVAAGAALGWGGYLNGRALLGLFNSDPGVIDQGMIRLKLMLTAYFLGAAMDVVNGGLRGMGRSVAPAAVLLFFACVFRILWVAFVFSRHPTLETLYLTYPISWALVLIVNGTMLWYICRRLIRGGGRDRPGVGQLRE